MIAHCHKWAGRTKKAIAVGRKVLSYDPLSYDTLATIFVEQGKHEDAAIHVRKGPENYPEPLPKIPGFLISFIRILRRFFPRYRDREFIDPFKETEVENTKWFYWAHEYLSWYEDGYDDQVKPLKN